MCGNKSDFVLLPEMCFADWLAADPEVDEGRWDDAAVAHTIRIAGLGRLGAKAVVGTRPIVTAQGSRRNEAYLWTAVAQAAAGVHQKYYLPDEEGYWENTWYEPRAEEF